MDIAFPGMQERNITGLAVCIQKMGRNISGLGLSVKKIWDVILCAWQSKGYEIFFKTSYQKSFIYLVWKVPRGLCYFVTYIHSLNNQSLFNPFLTIS